MIAGSKAFFLMMECYCCACHATGCIEEWIIVLFDDLVLTLELFPFENPVFFYSSIDFPLSLDLIEEVTGIVNW